MVTGVSLVTEVKQPQHGYEVRRTCYRFSASCHRLLSWQTPWRKKACFLAGKTRVNLYLQMKNRSPGHSNDLT